MALLAILLSVVGLSSAGTLLRRLHRARSAVRSVSIPKGQPSRLLQLLKDRLIERIDTDLLPDAGPGGLADLALRFREPQDRFANAADLLAAIARKAESRSPKDLLELLKNLYQLQDTLGLTSEEIAGCVEDVSGRLRCSVYLGSAVARVDIPRQGSAFDPKTMWALNPGGRVRQPLGVTLFGESGRVLEKAKVLCQ